MVGNCHHFCMRDLMYRGDIMARCPRCGSYNARYELRAAGTDSKSSYYRTGVKKSWILPAGRKTYSSNRRQKSVGFCPDCGYKWDEGAFSGSWFQKICFVVSALYVILGIVSVIGIFSSKKDWSLLLVIPEAIGVLFGGLIGIFGYGKREAVLTELGCFGLFLVFGILSSISIKQYDVSAEIFFFAVPAVLCAIKLAVIKKNEERNLLN